MCLRGKLYARISSDLNLLSARRWKSKLAGNRIITFLLEKFIHAIRHPQFNYSRLLLSQVPQQYDVHADSLYDKVLAVLDHVSGMTDVYALDLYRKLNGLSLPAV